MGTAPALLRDPSLGMRTLEGLDRGLKVPVALKFVTIFSPVSWLCNNSTKLGGFWVCLGDSFARVEN